MSKIACARVTGVQSRAIKRTPRSNQTAPPPTRAQAQTTRSALENHFAKFISKYLGKRRCQVLISRPWHTTCSRFGLQIKYALAYALRCSVKTVVRVLKIEGDEALPSPTIDVRYYVTAWKLWAVYRFRAVF